MSEFTSNLAGELGVRHNGAGITGAVSIPEAAAAISRLNGCSEAIAAQVAAALAPYASDVGCNKMFYSSLAQNYGAAERGDGTSLSTACFIDLSNMQNNEWSFADATDNLAAISCNGIVTALFGVAPSGVNLDDFINSCTSEIPHMYYGFMGFTLLLAQGANGATDVALGLPDASGADIEWFTFNTEQTEYLAAKSLFLSDGAFSSLYLRSALYMRTPINGVVYEGNDAIAEALIALIDPDTGGVVDVTPAEEIPEESLDLHEGEGDGGYPTGHDGFLNFNAMTEIEPETETISEPESETAPEPEPEPEPGTEAEQEADEVEDVGDLSSDSLSKLLEFEGLEIPDIGCDVDSFETVYEDDDEVNDELKSVTLGRGEVDAILRRVLCDSDEIVFAVINAPELPELLPSTPVNVEILCRVLSDDFYPDDTIATFAFYAESRAINGELTCEVAIEAIASAIWGRAAKYNRQRNLNHAAALLARHVDELWYGAYASDDVAGRLSALGYSEALCVCVKDLMWEVKHGGSLNELRTISDNIAAGISI